MSDGRRGTLVLLGVLTQQDSRWHSGLEYVGLRSSGARLTRLWVQRSVGAEKATRQCLPRGAQPVSAPANGHQERRHNVEGDGSREGETADDREREGLL